EETPEGFHVHDYLDFNPSAEDVKAARRENADRQRRWQHDRKSGRYPRVTLLVTELVTASVTLSVTPPRPDPLNTTASSTSSRPATIEEKAAILTQVAAEQGLSVDQWRAQFNRPCVHCRECRLGRHPCPCGGPQCARGDVH